MCFSQLETQMEVALQGRNISLIEPVQFETHENLDERDDLFVSYASLPASLCSQFLLYTFHAACVVGWNSQRHQ